MERDILKCLSAFEQPCPNEPGMCGLLLPRPRLVYRKAKVRAEVVCAGLLGPMHDVCALDLTAAMFVMLSRKCGA
jgi:hypothetical protein